MNEAISFESLIFPLTVADIISSYNAGTPLYQEGSAERFRSLCEAIKSQDDCLKDTDLNVTYASPGRESMSPLTPIEAGDIETHYDAGGTICITRMNIAFPVLNQLAKTCKASLGWSGTVDCRSYISNNGAGYTPHFDDKSVITLQLEGCKQWMVSNTPAIRNPLENAGRFPDGVYRYFRDKPFMEIWEKFEQPQFSQASSYNLKPGDILIVPSGVWHSACAKEHSLSLAITLNHVGSGSAHDLIFLTLLQQALSDPDWRGAVPMTPLHSRIESLDTIDNFFIDRLNALRDLVDKNLKDRTEIIRTWLRLISDLN
ncbi:JmjC domain-containing protein [Citrobacter youngae]|uniref:JmjC domain-containing protein n=1 Tax=Citrobacter youngae TaxID=133448 RepID=UPI0039B4AD45